MASPRWNMGSAMHRPGQSSALVEEAPVPLHTSMEPAACGQSMPAASVKEALSRVCLRGRSASGSITARNPIIIGFVGGFVRREDIRHPEVEFARLLRERYPSVVHAEVFSNHDGKDALRRVMHLSDKSTVTIQARDSNGNSKIVWVDTTKADPIPTIQVQKTPAEKP